MQSLILRIYVKNYSLCEEVKDSPGHRLAMSLRENGSYNADYGYDAIENYDSRFIMDWQSKYLD